MGEISPAILLFGAVVAFCLFGPALFALMRIFSIILLNLAIGFVILFVLNCIGAIFGFHCDITWWKSFETGLFGTPLLIFAWLKKYDIL